MNLQLDSLDLKMLLRIPKQLHLYSHKLIFQNGSLLLDLSLQLALFPANFPSVATVLLRCNNNE